MSDQATFKTEIKYIDIEEVKRIIGRKVKELRAKSGMTIEECAERTGITPRAFSKIEHGLSNPKASTMIGLSSCFNTPIDNFYITI